MNLKNILIYCSKYIFLKCSDLKKSEDNLLNYYRSLIIKMNGNVLSISYIVIQ